MSRGRLSKFISVVITGIISLSGLPSMVLADVINTPTFYSVQSDLNYEITTNITSSWINHESIDLILTNTGIETIHNWYLTFNIPYNIDNIWNGTIHETDGNGTYTITSNGWNQDIHTGESVTVGITFSSDTEEDLSVDPEWYLLNTQAAVVDASQYTLEYTEYSAWETGFTGQLTLTPQEDCQHWELSFGSNREITAVSSAVLLVEGDNDYAITHDENNMRLFAGTAYNFGIQGVNTEDPLELSNVELTAVDLAYHLTDDEDANGVPDYLEFIGGGGIIDPTPTPTPVPTDTPTITPTEEPTGTPTEEPTETPTPTSEPTPTPIIDDADQDLDGLPDYVEEQIGTDPLKADTDDDGLSDYIEVTIGYDPTNPDSDGNGIIDGDEDYDNDGLTNVQELLLGTQLAIEDSDLDDLLDGEEVNVYGTNPTEPDSDGDRIEDGDEVYLGKNPIDPSDGDVRILQTISRDIDNADDPAVTSVDVSVSLADRIDRSLNIRDYYNVDVYSTDVYGRIGSPINFECDESFDSATVVIHYDEIQLGSSEEGNLGVLWYDDANGVYIIQEQAIVDAANNTITLELSHFSTYVVVDLDMWNNPILPDYSNYIMIAEGGTGYYAWHDGIPTLDEEEYECFVWWKLSHGGQYRIVDRIYGYAHTDADPSKIIQLWEYSYIWLVMDMTDSDEDGVLDFMESQGVLGSNNHIYYSDLTAMDGDGDTLTDDEEIGARYTIHRTEDGVLRIIINQAVVYESEDGIINPESPYYVLNGYCESLGCGQIRTVAIIRSDAENLDCDSDGSYDAVDAYPMNVNPIINYLIVGQDSSNPDPELDGTANYYENLFNSEGMLYCRLDIVTWSDFENIWTHLKNIHVGDYTSSLEYYRSVDNIIFVCHGNEDGILFDPSDGNQGVNASDFVTDDSNIGLGDRQSASINVIDYISCYSANIGTVNNIALQTILNCDVRETYGFDGPTYYNAFYNSNFYRAGESNGYFRYYWNSDGECVCEKMPEVLAFWDYVCLNPAVLVDSYLHSVVSGE